MTPELQQRLMILCEQDVPMRCVQCDAFLPAAAEPSLMMINEAGEAVVCTGPVSFCTGCQAAYAPEKHYQAIAAEFDFNPFSLVGFLDLAQLPEAQRTQALGEDPEQDIPLVEFQSLEALRTASFD